MKKLLLVAATIVFLIGGCDEPKKNVDDSKNQENSITPKVTGEKPMGSTSVKLTTNKGDIVIELDEDKAPVTVKNFIFP